MLTSIIFMLFSNTSNTISSFGVSRTLSVPPRQISRIFNGKKPETSSVVLKYRNKARNNITTKHNGKSNGKKNVTKVWSTPSFKALKI